MSKRMLFEWRAFLLAAFVLAFSGAEANGQITLDNAYMRLSTLADAGGTRDSNVVTANLAPGIISDSASDSSDGRNASCSGLLEATLTHDASGPAYNGSFEASTDANASNSETGTQTEASSNGRMVVEFEVESDLARVTIDGMLTASGVGDLSTVESSAFLRIEGSGLVVDLATELPAHSSTEATDSVPVAVDVALPPAEYTLFFLCESRHTAIHTEDESASASMSVDFTIEHMLGEEVNYIFWQGGDGAFLDAPNWSPMMVPGGALIPVFEQAGASLITFTNATTEKAYLRRGDYTFSQGAYNVTGGSEEDAGFIVGNNPLYPATLTLQDGHSLDTMYGGVARTIGTEGTVLLSPDGTASAWTGQHIRIGDGGEGTAVVGDNGRIAADALVLGNAPGACGRLEATSNGTVGDPSVEALQLTIGRYGDGELIVEDDAVAAARLVMAEIWVSEAVLVSKGDFAAGEAVIGEWGEARVEVLEGGSFAVTDDSAPLLLGGSLGFGHLVVNGAGSVVTAAAALVGNGDTVGVLSAVNAGEAVITALSVGTTPQGLYHAKGAVHVDDPGVVMTNTLSAGVQGGLYGDGTIVVTTGPAMATGSVLSGGEFSIIVPDRVRGVGPMLRMPGFGTLQIDGGLTMTGGRVEATIGGDGGGAFDVVSVTGDANFDGTTIHAAFVDEFAPAVGTRYSLVTATGTLTAENLLVSYAGLTEDFEVVLDVEANAIVLEVVEAGEPMAASEKDINRDGAVDAVDVQLVINGALGLVDLEPTDVNLDAKSDAIDVQLVVNAALGARL